MQKFNRDNVLQIVDTIERIGNQIEDLSKVANRGGDLKAAEQLRELERSFERFVDRSVRTIAADRGISIAATDTSEVVLQKILAPLQFARLHKIVDDRPAELRKVAGASADPFVTDVKRIF
jgi:hypothetical protein